MQAFPNRLCAGKSRALPKQRNNVYGYTERRACTDTKLIRINIQVIANAHGRGCAVYFFPYCPENKYKAYKSVTSTKMKFLVHQWTKRGDGCEKAWNTSLFTWKRELEGEREGFHTHRLMQFKKTVDRCKHWKGTQLQGVDKLVWIFHQTILHQPFTR